MLDEIKKQLKGIGIVLLLPLLIPLALLFLLVLLLIIIPLDTVERRRQRRKVDSFLQENDYTRFFIYSSGKRKAAFVRKHVLPTLNPGVEVVKYDGSKYDRFFEPETYYSLIHPSEKGYPIIGKIEGGKIHTLSLKEEFSQLVLKEKEAARFVDLLHQKLDAL